MTLLDLVLRGLVIAAMTFFWRVILFPAVLIVGTPFVLLRAGGLALRRRQKFRYAIADGYGGLSSFWFSGI